jgi:hypothetical protein
VLALLGFGYALSKTTNVNDSSKVLCKYSVLNHSAADPIRRHRLSIRMIIIMEDLSIKRATAGIDIPFIMTNHVSNPVCIDRQCLSTSNSVTIFLGYDSKPLAYNGSAVGNSLVTCLPTMTESENKKSIINPSPTVFKHGWIIQVTLKFNLTVHQCSHLLEILPYYIST